MYLKNEGLEYLRYPWNWLIKYFLRILNLLISAYAAFRVYNFVYDRYSTYLPIKYYLDQLNTQNSISVLLRENSQGFRELYIHNFEKSLLYSFISFIFCFLIIEYIYRSNQKQKENSLKAIHERIGMLKEQSRIAEMNKSDADRERDKKFQEAWDRT